MARKGGPKNEIINDILSTDQKYGPLLIPVEEKVNILRFRFEEEYSYDKIRKKFKKSKESVRRTVMKGPTDDVTILNSRVPTFEICFR